MDAPVRKNYWIISPTVDLSCIIFGWILFFLAPYFLSEYYETFRLISITFLAGAHRYFTIPLVYMDRTEFNRRRNVYILTPILCFLFVSLAYYFRIDEPEMYALFYLFNYFHFVRQKYGILRIYSGKAGWGQKQLDSWTTYLWGFAGFFYIFSYESDTADRFIDYLRNLTGFSPPPILADSIYVAATAVSIAWLIYEFRGPQRLNMPKLLFFLSVVFLYGIGPMLSVGSIFISTTVSHAAEYIALVALTIKNKTRTQAIDSRLLNKASERIVLNTFLFTAVTAGFLYGLTTISMFAFLLFAYSTAFVHFIFDGMIWRIRRPKVAREVGMSATAV